MDDIGRPRLRDVLSPDYVPGGTCTCGAPLATPLDSFRRRCAPCVERSEATRRELDEREAREQRSARLRAVLRHIPEHYAAPAEEGIGPVVRSRVARAAAVDEAVAAMGAPMILLVGPAGSGKTTLAAALIGEIVRRALAGDASAEALLGPRARWGGGGARWAEAADLARARRNHRLGDGEAPLIEDALSASLLVVDDLGAERGDADGGLADVLWERHQRERPCVWTTGLSSAQITERYGSGFLRRLTEPGYARVIRCDERTAR